MLILFLFLFSPSFSIALLDNFNFRKLYQSLDDKNVVFAVLKLFGMNEEGLMQQNPKKRIFTEREKNKEEM